MTPGDQLRPTVDTPQVIVHLYLRFSICVFLYLRFLCLRFLFVVLDALASSEIGVFLFLYL